MNLYEGHLHNTPTDIVIDLSTIALVVYAYYTQIRRFWRGHGSSSITPCYAFLGIMFGNAQLSIALIDAVNDWPSSEQRLIGQLLTGTLAGWSAFGAVLGLVQVIVHWICCVLLLLSLKSLHRGESAPFWAIVAAFLHFVTTVQPVLIVVLPTSQEPTMGAGIATAIVTFVCLTTAPAAIILLLVAQMLDLQRQHADSAILSPEPAVLQATGMSLLAIRWFQRLGSPTWVDRFPFELGGLLSLYAWGFLAINYALVAMSFSLVALVSLYLIRTRPAVDPERQPLLQ